MHGDFREETMTFGDEPTERKKGLELKVNLAIKKKVEKLKSIRGMGILSWIF